jgi:hypothetical protein
MEDFSGSACGATSVAILSSKVDPNITPLDTGRAAYRKAGAEFGSRTKRVTDFDILTGILNDRGINTSPARSRQAIIDHLRSGNPVLLHVSHRTVGDQGYDGHYVTLLGINDQDQIFLGDPKFATNCKYHDLDKVLPQNYRDSAYLITYN